MEQRLLDGAESQDFADIIRDKYLDLVNLEKYSTAENYTSEGLAELADRYIRKYKDLDLYVPDNSQVLIYSMRTRWSLNLPLEDDVQTKIRKKELSLLYTPIVLEIEGNPLEEPRNNYWIKEFNHLKYQLCELYR